MPFAVKLDEDLSPQAAEPLARRGYDARTVVRQGWRGLKDHELWPLVCAEGIFWVTADMGFANILEYPPGTHPGILVLRADRESIVEYTAILEIALTETRLESLAGCVAVATRRGVRARRPSG